MANHFVVSTKTETPNLYLAQAELGDVLSSLANWTNMYNHTAHVFAMRKISAFGSQIVSSPMGHAQLACVARILPNAYLDHCMWAWGNQLDDVPYEQALEKIQEMRDYIDKRQQSLTFRQQRDAVQTTEETK